MKRLLILSLCMVSLMVPSSCSTASRKNAIDNMNNGLKAYNDKDSCVQAENDSISNAKSLNDIRFSNFKDKDWIDNDYIRALREHIDAYKRGKVKDDELDKYNDDIQGKFVIGHTEPFLLGGLFIEFMFVDKPEKIFSAWVYSEVDEQKESVTGYSVRSIQLEDQSSGFTSKQQILQTLKEHPEYKMW